MEDSSHNKKGVGFWWQDPNNKGNGVRIDKGDLNVSQSTTTSRSCNYLL